MPHKSGLKRYPGKPNHERPKGIRPSKSLPEQASETAKKRAFGQRGLEKRSSKSKGKN